MFCRVFLAFDIVSPPLPLSFNPIPLPMTTTIIIPARYPSTRYPGKPLVKLLGREAVLRTYDAARRVRRVDAIYIATDSAQIRDVAESSGASVIMTSPTCRNGTERVAEAARILRCKKNDILVNFQGDAPLTPPWFVEAILKKLQTVKTAAMVTPVLRCDEEAYERLRHDRKHGRVGAVTAVFGPEGRAIYFSKEPIPYMPNLESLRHTPVFHHVGVYGYRMEALQAYAQAKMGPLEKAEQLEQLRFIETHRPVYVVEVKDRGVQFWELNNPADVKVIEKMMKANAQRLG